ncbi:hypothetical protein ACIQYS_05960 [Psychrobacillus sp. NPDC096426]|uniref:flagellin N-terminal helical domain-containing protein n=1 Tax=Psychrobacillus sp. NPDC096426 TaxID=3364491 RepID=UPI0038139CFE
MAGKNIQNGISLIQTEEGAMNEIHSLLQRGRELSVQASNDTNTNEDRIQLQSEVNQIIYEINGISNRTEFNTLKVLIGGGTLGSGVAVPTKYTIEETAEKLFNYMLENAEQVVLQGYGLATPSIQDVTFQFTYDGQGGRVAWVTGSTNGIDVGLSLTIDQDDLKNDLWISQDRIIAHEMVHAAMFTPQIGFGNGVPSWFMEGTAEYLAGGDERLQSSLSRLGNPQNVVNQLHSSGSDFYSASYAATKYLDKTLADNGTNMKSLMTDLQSTKNLNQSLKMLQEIV